MYEIKPEKTHTHLYVERICLSTLTPVNSLIFPQSFFFRPGYLTWPIEHRRRLSYYDIRPVQFHGRQALWALFSSFGPQREALWDSSIHWLALGDKRHLVGMRGSVFEDVHACLAGFYVGVLSGVYQRACCVRVSCSRWKMNVRGEESIDPGASSTWCEEMSTTWTDSEQFSAAI